jgi:hypothetical protein
VTSKQVVPVSLNQALYRIWCFWPECQATCSDDYGRRFLANLRQMAVRRVPSMEEAGSMTRPDLWSCGGAPRRNRTGDPILTIDARVVHDALQHLTCPHREPPAHRWLRLWGGARLRVAQFLANLWQAFPAKPSSASPASQPCRSAHQERPPVRAVSLVWPLSASTQRPSGSLMVESGSDQPAWGSRTGADSGHQAQLALVTLAEAPP